MWKIVAILTVAGATLFAGQIADYNAAMKFTDTTPQLMYAGIRG